MSHTFYRTAQEKECRIPFFGPLKGACPRLCPQKGKTTFFLIKMGDTFNDFTIKMEEN